MAATITLDLLIDKEQNQVVFAESGHEFVDALFSFLTLPMGTIVRLLGKRSNVGSMDKLYKSVEELDAGRYFETEACKTMLLEPRSAAEGLLGKLAICVDDTVVNPRQMYVCADEACVTKTGRAFSWVAGARCRCGRPMTRAVPCSPSTQEEDGGAFVKGTPTPSFIISDDLLVSPVSMGFGLAMLQRHGTVYAKTLEKRTVHVGKPQMLKLLGRLLVSQTPLTDVFVGKPAAKRRRKPSSLDYRAREFARRDQVSSTPVSLPRETRRIHVKLLQSKHTSRGVVAEAGEDLVDLLFSFLTFPLGSIVRLFSDQPAFLGCVHNLYKSVQYMGVDGECCIKSEQCKQMLLAPRLFPYFGCSSQLLRVPESQSDGTARRCYLHEPKDCTTTRYSACKKAGYKAELNAINPKLSSHGSECGGGFAKRSLRFMVTPDMFVKPASVISRIGAFKESEMPITCLAEKEIALGQTEALVLLKACLVSPTALGYIFPPKNYDEPHRRTQPAPSDAGFPSLQGGIKEDLPESGNQQMTKHHLPKTSNPGRRPEDNWLSILGGTLYLILLVFQFFFLLSRI